MKEIKYTYKFKLKPTKEQEIKLNKHFGSVRFVYNYFLNQRKNDVNAAINIFNEGCRKNMSGGTSDYKRRAKIRLSNLESTSDETFKEKSLV